MNIVRLHLGKIVLSIYRWSAILLLYGVLAGVIGYIGVMGFYVFNSTWTAPIIISPSNTQILSLTAQLVSSTMQRDNYMLDRDRQQITVVQLKRQVLSLQALDLKLDAALALIVKENKANGPALVSLDRIKVQDIVRTEPLVNEIQSIEKRIDNELSAGLITKTEAMSERVALSQISNGLTDSRIGEVLLRDNIRNKTNGELGEVDILGKKAQLQAQIAQFNVLILSGEHQIVADGQQIETLDNAMDIAKQTPYYLASTSTVGQNFAFVPYDNEHSAQRDAPVYDCYLNMIVCYKVGTVGRIYNDEEHTVHPMFKTDLRGFLVQLNLTNPKAAKHKVLFLGGKPLLF